MSRQVLSLARGLYFDMRLYIHTYFASAGSEGLTM